MSSSIKIFGWNHSMSGQEHEHSNLVVDFDSYLKRQMENGVIKSYQLLFSDDKGKDTNGFFIIQGDDVQLDDLCSREEWGKYVAHHFIWTS